MRPLIPSPPIIKYVSCDPNRNVCIWDIIGLTESLFILNLFHKDNSLFQNIQHLTSIWNDSKLGCKLFYKCLSL